MKLTKKEITGRLPLFSLWVVFAAFGVFLDQITKNMAVSDLKGQGAKQFIPYIFDLIYVENRGAAWGMFQGSQLPLTVFAVFALVWLMWKIRPVYLKMRGGVICLALLAGGILGNSYDRLFRTGVIDFLDFHWGDSHFPAFNIADSCICVGVALLCLLQFLADRKKGKSGLPQEQD